MSSAVFKLEYIVCCTLSEYKPSNDDEEVLVSHCCHTHSTHTRDLLYINWPDEDEIQRDKNKKVAHTTW